MSCGLRLGVNNYVELATLTATPTAVEADKIKLDNLKNYGRARVAKWSDMSTGSIVIEGVLPQQVTADFFALPGSNLTPSETVQLELFETDTSTVDLLNMGAQSVATPIPLGVWRAGIDVYNGEGRVSTANIVAKWFDSTIVWQKFRLTITHGYNSAAPVTNTIPRQDDATGILAIEAEDYDVYSGDDGTHSWATVSDGDASGGSYMYKAGVDVIWDPTQGPSLSYTFTASQSGSMDLWVRVKTQNDSNSIYTLYDGVNAIEIINTFYTDWTWVNIRTFVTTAEQDHNLVFSARDWYYFLDKFVIQPAGTAAPTGTGPTASSFGTVDSSDNISLRSLFIGDAIEFDYNYSQGSEIQFLTDPDLPITASGFAGKGRAQNYARRMSLQLAMMTDADKLKLAEMEQALAGAPFMIAGRPEGSGWEQINHTMLGRFSTANVFADRATGFHRTNIDVVEA